MFSGLINIKVENSVRIFGFIACFAVGMWLGTTCERDQERTTSIKTETTSDTVKVTETDTVVQMDTIMGRVEPDTVIREIVPDSIYHTVRTEYKDRNLKAIVETDLEGEFHSQSMDYEIFKQDSTIHRTDSVLVTDSVVTTKTITKQPSWELGIGGTAQGGKNYFDLGPKLSLEKDGVQLGYAYGVLHKTHQITLQKKFNLSD